MMRARSSVFLLGGLALGACSGNDSPVADGPGLSSSSTSSSPPDTSTGSPGRSSSGAVDTSSGPPPDGSTTLDPSGSSSGAPCPAGTEGCPCDAGTCEGELVCVADQCQTPQCDGDVFEPNEDENTPMELGELSDDDDDGGAVAASLHFPGDVDWFRYVGDDDILSSVDPTRDLGASAGVRLCKFLECLNGLAQTEVSCPTGTDYALSPLARPGCCASEGFGLPDFNCAGVTEDNAAVFIRVDQPEDDCVTYSVSYHY